MPAGFHRTNPNVIVVHVILFEHPILCHLPEPFVRVADPLVIPRTVCCGTTQRGWAPFVAESNMVAYTLR